MISPNHCWWKHWICQRDEWNETDQVAGVRGGGVGRGLVGVEIKFKREKWIIKSRARMPLHFSFNWIQSIDGSFHQFTPNEWTQYWKSEQAFGSCAKIKPWTSEFVCVCVCLSLRVSVCKCRTVALTYFDRCSSEAASILDFWRRWIRKRVLLSSTSGSARQTA